MPSRHRRNPLIVASHDPLSTEKARASSVAPTGPYLRPRASHRRLAQSVREYQHASPRPAPSPCHRNLARVQPTR
ncbi:hypothetical protein K523DRAFT_422500 [Schizophyllum commune Tattone D]|nr:hypothetical protein K523DRAFT_422500 [Schizophyllum commune Tattone D]